MNKPATTEGLERRLDRIKDSRAAHPRAAGRRGRSDRADEHRRADRLRRREDHAVGSGADALAALKEKTFDCIRARPAAARRHGLRADGRASSRTSVARHADRRVHRSRAVDGRGEELRQMAKSIVLKGVASPERLLDETALFLHRVITDLPPRSSA
jgi:hypothetical protein